MTLQEAIERIEKSGVPSFDIDVSFQRRNGNTRAEYKLWIGGSNKATCNNLDSLVAIASVFSEQADTALAAAQVDTLSQAIGKEDDKFTTL